MKNKCCVDGCENEVKARGYCAKHYSRAKYYGKIKTEEIKHDNNIFINVLENYAVIKMKIIEKIKIYYQFTRALDRFCKHMTEENYEIVRNLLNKL